jgi:hypothetical protein
MAEAATTEREKRDQGSKDSGSENDVQDAKGKDVKEESEPTFSHERLIKECISQVGHPAHVIRGALHRVSKQNLTLDECRDLCEKWLGTDK